MLALAAAALASAGVPKKTRVDLNKTKTVQHGGQVRIAGTILPRKAAAPHPGVGQSGVSVTTIAVNGRHVTPTSLGNAIIPAANGTFVYKAVVGMGSATYEVKFLAPVPGPWRSSKADVTVTMTP